MANSFFGWKERDIDQLVDWSSVTDSVSKSIKDEASARETKRAELRKSSDDYVQKVSSIELGDDVDANQAIMSASNQLSQGMLMLNKLLNAGDITIQDYTSRRQKLFDGADGVISAFKNYNDLYSKKLQRSINNESMGFESFLMEGVEGYTDFKNMRVYVNPLNSQVGVAKFKKNEKTGNMEVDTSPGNIMPMNVMNNILKTEYNKYDFDAVLSSGADRLGKEITKQISGGYFETVEDVMNKEDFKKSEKLFIDGMLSNPYNASDILYNALGYSFTWDPEEAKKDKNKILVGYDPNGNPVPKINDDQKKEAEDAMRERFRTMLDRSVKKDAIPKYGYSRGRTTTAPTTTSKSYNQMTDKEREAYIDALTSKGRGIVTEQMKTQLSPQMIDRDPSVSIPQLQTALGGYASYFDFKKDGDKIVVVPLGAGGAGYTVPTRRLKYYPSSDKQNAGKVLPEYESVQEEMRENLNGLAAYMSTYLSTDDIVTGLGLNSIRDLDTGETQGGSSAGSGSTGSVFDELDEIVAEQ